MQLAFLGLGVMGYPMAGHLQQAGHSVCVYNRTTTKAKAWVQEYKGNFASTPKDAVKDADMVFACVGNDNDIYEVACDKQNGAFYGMKKGTIFIDHTTASAKMAQTLAKEAKALDLAFMDAPVSGGEAGAKNGALTIMCGGDQNIFDTMEPIVKIYSKYCGLIGKVGSGQQTKMVNQIAIAGLLQGLSEAVNFGMCANLDMDKVLEAISGGAAGSWQMTNRVPTMVKGEFDFGFAIDWMRKDLAICFEEAKVNGAKLPIAKIVDNYYATIQAKGGNRYDTSALILNIADNTDT